MMRMLPVLIILGFATSQVTASCKGAQQRAVLKCYETWVGAYGMILPTPITLPQYGDIHAVRMSWFTGQGNENQQKVCDLGNALITCLQPHWTCLDNETYENMGQDKFFANLYHSDLYITQFQCSERGISLIMPTITCIEAARDSGGSEQQGVCADSIDRFIAEAGNRCGGYNKFLSCMHQVFLPSCGPDAAAFICGTNRAGLLAHVSWCGTSPAADILQCPIVERTSSSAMGAAMMRLISIMLPFLITFI